MMLKRKVRNFGLLLRNLQKNQVINVLIVCFEALIGFHTAIEAVDSNIEIQQSLFRIFAGGKGADLYEVFNRQIQKFAKNKALSDRCQPFEDSLLCNDGHNEKVDGQTP